MSATPTESALVRYVPRIASEWASDRMGPWQELDSTLCFVDLSGFTKLSERLSKRGRIGAEELTDVLSRVFGEMLELAYERGGSLIKFGGDALLLHFASEDHALQAASAAVEMRTALRGAAQYRTSVGRLRLRMSVGIHSGVVHMFKVGTSHRELVITGPAASRVALMESTADTGDILVSPETAALLPRGAVGEAKGPGFLLRSRSVAVARPGSVERRAASFDDVADCLPVVLRRYLAHGAAEPEHRLATVGFIKFRGVDELMESLGPVAVADALHGLMSIVQIAVDAAGVTLLATDIDKNGGKVIVVTGVPVTQVDDDGRMLRAMRAIIDANTRLSVSIGVHRGHVFAGEVGAERRATFTVMGDTVNLAARLMSAAAPGELYTTPEVLERSGTLFAAVALEPFFVKGKINAVQAYSVSREIGPRTASSHELPFFGRDTAMAVLAEALAAACDGVGSTVTIVGPTGVGKSRLIAEARALAPEITTLAIHAEHAGSTSPYRAFRDPIRALLGIERDERSAMAEQLKHAVSSLAPHLLPLLPLVGDVTHIDVPSTAAVDSMELRFRPERTAVAVVSLLEAVVRGPMLFIVEDAQWMDSGSAALIERLLVAGTHRPWLVIVARRDEPGGVDPSKGARIGLATLDPADATAIVIAATAAAPLRTHELELIVQRSGGSPLFLGELLRVARSGGVDHLPASLDAVVNAELDALGVLARRLVRYASVLGRSFGVSLLREVLAEEDIELDDATMRELGRFLEFEGTELIRFRHAMHRDVAYEGLPYRRRRELHLRAGQITERLAGDDLEPVADVLSMHYSLAQDHDRAWHYARIAGDRARNQYANLEAASQYERAIEAARRITGASARDVVELWRVLGDVREQLALFEDAIEAYRRAARVADADPVLRADLLWRRARVRMHLGAYRTALGEATTARRLLGEGDEPTTAAMRARLTALQALLRQAQQRAEPARQLASRAIIEASTAVDDAALARAYLVSDWANRVLGAADETQYGELALEIYERLGDLDGAGKASNNLGGIAYFGGLWDDAVKWYSKALEAYRRCGNDASAAVAGSNLAEVLVSRRDYAEAEPMLLESVRVLRAAHALDDVLFAEIQLGRLFVDRGDHEKAVDHLNGVRREALDVGQVGYAFEAALHLAAARIALHEYTGAIDLLERATRDVGLVDAVYQPSVARLRALALAGNGWFDAARLMLADGLASAREQSLTYEEGLLLLASATVERLDGQHPDDVSMSAARAIFDRLGVPFDASAVELTGT